jgi:phage-related holin
MLEAIIATLKIMGWLGIILGILVIVNISSKTIYNVWSSKELFSWKKMLKGIGKSLVFYLSAVAISVACTMLPYVNEMITATFGVMLVSNETLEVLSSVGVLGIVMAAVVSQAKKAITGISTLSKVSTSNEEITWTVEEE